MLKRLLLTCAIAFAIIACKEDERDPNIIDIKGITRTADDGTVLEVDPDDWKPLPGLQDVSLYPNPVYNNTALRLNLKTASHVKVWAVNSRNETVKTFFEGDLDTGVREFVFNDLPTGLMRMYIEVGNKRTYGDIEVIDLGK